MKTKQKIRILYGLEAASGGALKHLTYLVMHLDKTQFEISVIISPHRADTRKTDIDKLKQSGARVIEIAMERSFNLLKDGQAICKVIRHLGKNKYDIIHAHSSKAGFVCRIAAWLTSRAQVIYTPHCFYFSGQTGRKKWLYSRVEKLLGKITAYIIVSDNEKEEALQHRIVPSEKVININNAINFDEYSLKKSRDSIKSQWGIPEQSVVIGTVGRLTRQKDLETFIYTAGEVVKSYKNAVFLIVGDGELKEELSDLICKHQLENKVIITGYHDEVSDVFNIMDVFVSTSLWEGIPYVILEAMWFKKPVVASDLGYNGLVYDKENGFLVKAGQYKDFAEIIKALLKNEGLRIEIGNKGHMLVNKKFDFESFIRGHENFYSNITGRYKLRE